MSAGTDMDAGGKAASAPSPASPLLTNAADASNGGTTGVTAGATTGAAEPELKYWLHKQVVNQLGYGGCALLYTLLWYFLARDADDAAARRTTVLLIMWDAHFIKRCLECLFVHKWSNPKNDIPMSVGEWIYYWGFTFFVGWSVNKPWGHFRSAALGATTFYIFVAMFAVAVCGNGAAHLQLRLTRPTRYTQFPTGPLFCLVSCPHYLFEILTWAAFTGASQTYGAAVFLLGTLVTLCMWARERHLKYREHFDGSTDDRPLYPTVRKALFPFVF